VASLIDIINDNEIAMKTLKFSENKIGDLTCAKLESLMVNCDSLEVLDLKWNKITLEGANKIVSGLDHSRSLKMLDISWNRIGIKEEMEFG